jgi:hypothetical protein
LEGLTDLEEGLLMIFATYNDLKEVEPNIDEYGVIEWDIELERASEEVTRILRVRWYKEYQRRHPIIHKIDLDPAKLRASQFTKATVFYAMAYHICTKLTQFTPEEDRFKVMMDYYQGRFEHEMDLILREGVDYDLNDDEVFSSEERGKIDTQRLRR